MNKSSIDSAHGDAVRADRLRACSGTYLAMSDYGSLMYEATSDVVLQTYIDLQNNGNAPEGTPIAESVAELGRSLQTLSREVRNIDIIGSSDAVAAADAYLDDATVLTQMYQDTHTGAVGLPAGWTGTSEEQSAEVLSSRRSTDATTSRLSARAAEFLEQCRDDAQ